jgi:hypothetical protein
VRPGPIVSVFAAAALLAACSSQPSAPTPAPTTQSPAPTHGALSQCLAEHGVPAAPGPTTGPPAGVDQGAWERATQACSSLEPGPAN